MYTITENEICLTVTFNSHHIMSTVHDQELYELKTIIHKTDNKNIVFDFSNVTMIDSIGIGVVLLSYKKTKASNNTLTLLNLNSDISYLFDTLGLHYINQDKQ